LKKKKEKITDFFTALGERGWYVTLSGGLASVEGGLLAFRIPTWPSQGGYLTHNEGQPTTFCGIVCCSSKKDHLSNYNAAVDATSQLFLKAYSDAVVPTLRLSEMPATLDPPRSSMITEAGAHRHPSAVSARYSRSTAADNFHPKIVSDGSSLRVSPEIVDVVSCYCSFCT
jgi:hypothetical protein